jgi:hypothetical protein
VRNALTVSRPLDGPAGALQRAVDRGDARVERVGDLGRGEAQDPTDDFAAGRRSAAGLVVAAIAVALLVLEPEQQAAAHAAQPEPVVAQVCAEVA